MNTLLYNKFSMTKPSNGYILLVLILIILILSVLTALAIKLNTQSARQLSHELTFSRTKLAAESALTLATHFIEKQQFDCTDLDYDFGDKIQSFSDIKVHISCQTQNKTQQEQQDERVYTLQAVAMHGHPGDYNYISYRKSLSLTVPSNEKIKNYAN